MSTEKPHSLQKRKPSTSSAASKRIVALACLALHFGLCVLAGFAIGWVLDQWRVLSFQDLHPARLYMDLPFLFAVGFFASIFFWFIAAALSARAFESAGLLISLASAALGTSIGLVVFFPNWAAPEMIGYYIDPFDKNGPLPWDISTWISYWQPYWLPTLFVTLSLLLAILCIPVGINTKRRKKKIAETLDHGVHVQGTITDTNGTNRNPYLRQTVKYTVKFSDTNGTDRWIIKRNLFDTPSIPQVGDAVTVWFNPLRPDDQESIVVRVKNSLRQ